MLFHTGIFGGWSLGFALVSFQFFASALKGLKKTELMQQLNQNLHWVEFKETAFKTTPFKGRIASFRVFELLIGAQLFA